MPSDKDRLYVCLYARSGAAKMPGKEDTYVEKALDIHTAAMCTDN